MLFFGLNIVPAMSEGRRGEKTQVGL